MSDFLKKTLTFLLPLLGYCAINGFINYCIFLNQKPDLKVSTLIIGDSHAKYGIDPSLFKNARNIAQAAEPLVVTFWKLKYLLKFNKIDTLILSFGPHKLSAVNDSKFSDEAWSKELFRRCYFIEEFNQIEKYVEIDYYNYYKTLGKNICFYPKFKHLNFIGSYSPRAGINLKDTIDVVKRHYYYNGAVAGVSEISINYMDSIVSIAEKNNILLVVVSHPVHENYYKNIPDIHLKAYRNVKSKLLAGGIQVIDQLNQFYPDSLYFNSDHLNIQGAKIFTEQIVGELKKKPAFGGL